MTAMYQPAFHPIAAVSTCKLNDLNSVSKMEDEALFWLALSPATNVVNTMDLKPD
jgi:hypothetical protein